MATPVPDKLTTSGEFGELLTMETLPVTLPADVGANFALNVVDCPAARVAGVASPLMLKPAPETFACEIEMLADPEFVSVMEDEVLAPTFTLPNVTLRGFAVRLP